MLDPGDFYKYLNSIDVNFFTGVPDSLLKSFCGYVADHSPSNSHIISSNEGAAVGIGIGYHLATGNIPMVYMQNSGLGNAINPLISLADQEVYSIPMIILIGWRGEPKTKDEPQHIKQGSATIELLDIMDIPYVILDSKNQDIEGMINNLKNHSLKSNSPVAILVRKNLI